MLRVGDISDFCLVMVIGVELLVILRRFLEYCYIYVDIVDIGIGIKVIDVLCLFYKFV